MIVKQIDFDDSFVRGIKRVYDEVPIRGGRRAWHYRDDFETCKRKHETYRARSDFIAAYFEGELVGFVKLVYAGDTARTMQNLTMVKCRGLSVSNALLAKCAEICTKKSIKFLVFGKLSYGKKGDLGLEQFKRDNGFVKLDFPRYYVPLNWRGNLAISLGLYKDVSDFLPPGFVGWSRNTRTAWYHWLYRKELAVKPLWEGSSRILKSQTIRDDPPVET